ncbi:hypothetical protein BT96DRAFT_1014052 [Gymnopus androsaceus JB14]|uniref:Uncharacterized protein n=1 Tax=Gymnopus androsaceus JB14 TaxID=1447944 RepID=A0A6A4IEH6_9AGAR|nr:hypothetical protein BT96DRAFT_1014052 [Gymnopus androsaceus JB14]
MITQSASESPNNSGIRRGGSLVSSPVIKGGMLWKQSSRENEVLNERLETVTALLSKNEATAISESTSLLPKRAKLVIVLKSLELSTWTKNHISLCDSPLISAHIPISATIESIQSQQLFFRPPFCHSLMFALPDYGEHTIFPPASSTPANQIDAYCMHMMQKMMADSYIQGRKYWDENPHAHDGVPNESQVEVEKFLEFTGLLPKRERPADLEPVFMKLDEESFSESDVASHVAKARPRWRRYISLPSGSSAPAFLRSESSSRLRSMSLTLPVIGPLQCQPAHTRATSEPTKPSLSKLALLHNQPGRFTLEESQIAFKSRVAGISTAPPSPLSSYSCSPRTPRFPCDYLPLTPTKSPTKRRKRPTAKAKLQSQSTDSLAIPVQTDTRPLTFDRDPPPGSPSAIRKIPLPPPNGSIHPSPRKCFLLKQ